MTLIAVDPGPVVSSYVSYFVDGKNGELLYHETLPNEKMLELPKYFWSADAVVIEKIECYGMAVGAEVFETVYFSGRLHQTIVAELSIPVHRLPRREVKLYLCQSPRAKDPNVRVALIDRFGGPDSIKKGGQLYKVAKDRWAALGVAVTWAAKEATVA